MLSVAEAHDIILRSAQPLPSLSLPLVPAALGLVLAEDVASDVFSPPFDKALMDGYAVRSADLPTGEGELQVIEEITAGSVPRREVGPRQASRIMTGAPMPSGADAVVVIEKTELLQGERVRIQDRPPRPRQNMMLRGTEMKAGQTVLSAGTVLRPQEFGVLASVGRAEARLVPPPVVAVLPTGDELVEAGEKPGPGQIRNSNGPMLAAQVVRAGGNLLPACIARDTEEHLRANIRQGLQADVLILSGGVSAGKLDLVPKVLRELGVQEKIHKVQMKPGKPLFFGDCPRVGRPDALVFGLPGNPVSSFVCFELFVRPALNVLRGLGSGGPVFLQALLAEDCSHRSDRPTYHPALLVPDRTERRVRLVPWLGSPDLLGLTRANSLVAFPPGEHQYRVGDILSVLCLE